MGNCMSFRPLQWTDGRELCSFITTSAQLMHPVQCVDNSEGRDAVVVFDSESFPNKHHFIGQLKISVQCLEDPEGEDGVVVIDHQSFPRPTAF